MCDVFRLCYLCRVFFASLAAALLSPISKHNHPNSCCRTLFSSCLFASLRLVQREHRPTFPKSESIRGRLYDNSSLAKTTLRLKIPTSPESDGEIYLTPNTTVNLNDTNGTPIAETPPNFRITKIQSMGNIPSTTKRRFNEMLDAPDETNCDENDDQTKATMTTTVPPDMSVNVPLYRMKSLGNLTQDESSFGDTPKELTMLKEEFERRRAGLVRRRSLTNLLADTEPDVTDSSAPSPVVSPRKDSIFASKGTIGHNKYRKKFGVGDTKYIGQDDSIDSNNMLYHLTKIKSVGTIPDVVGEPVNFEPFLTPITVRRHPVSLHEFRGGTEATSSSSDGDDESAFLEQRNMAGGVNTSLRFINEVSLLRAPFERGFRRSYVKENQLQTQTSAPLRQSDGYFKAPLLPGMYNQQRPKSAGMASAAGLKTMDKHKLASLHNVSAATGGSGGLNGKGDSIR